MTSRLARLRLTLGALLAPAVALAANTEQVRLPAMPGYAQAHQDTDPQGNRLVEYVPQGQTVQDWTDMVTVNTAPHAANATPREFLGIIEAGWKLACPDAQANWVGEGEEEGRPFAVLMLGCPRNPGTGKPEFTWIKGIQGLQGFHTVQKAFRSEPEPKDVVTWMGWLRDVALCGNGQAPACAPEAR
ncbi:hypothetical protein [Stenotrophomonas sp. B1-1]|uniref:hypothetical protein n=1 Tax=Stenotrophomonas sp. B1-1 TaxID=2710648 RepID=UPI001F07ADD9|nr:hypothetical protein [Stenotrophomonas sp. B1-1]